MIIFLLFVDSTKCSSSGGVFFNNHCYWVSSEKVDSIVEARNKCQRKNARLVSIETAEELTFLSAHLQGDQSTKWLTSGREIGNSNPRQWAWSLDPSWQQPIKYQQETQWQPGQPDNKLERCIALSKKNGVYWSDTDCAPGGKQLHFICEQGRYNYIIYVCQYQVLLLRSLSSISCAFYMELSYFSSFRPSK